MNQERQSLTVGDGIRFALGFFAAQAFLIGIVAIAAIAYFADQARNTAPRSTLPPPSGASSLPWPPEGR